MSVVLKQMYEVGVVVVVVAIDMNCCLCHSTKGPFYDLNGRDVLLCRACFMNKAQKRDEEKAKK